VGAVVWGDVEVELAPTALALQPGEPSVTLEGKVLGGAELVYGIATGSGLGVNECQADPAVGLPAFRLECDLGKPPAARSYVQIFTLRRGRPVGEEAGLVAFVDGSPESRRLTQARFEGDGETAVGTGDAPEAVGSAPIGGGAGESVPFREQVALRINGLRQEAGLPPLRFLDAQSAQGDRLAAAYYGAVARGDVSRGDQAVISMLAGWNVRGGLVRDGEVAVFGVGAPVGPDEWVAMATEMPLTRHVLFQRASRVAALGWVVDPETGGTGGMIASWSFFDDSFDREVAARSVLRQLQGVRDRRGKGTLVLASNGGEELRREALAVEAEGRRPVDALNRTLGALSSRLAVDVQGWVVETSDVEAIRFPRELVEAERPRLVAAVTRHQAPGSPWGQMVVFLIYFPR